MENITFDIKPDDREINTLVQCKYLYSQGIKHLESKFNSIYYNISVVIFSNAVEIGIRILNECLNGRELKKFSDNSISYITKQIQKDKRNINLPFNDIIQLFNSRNTQYHDGTLFNYDTCVNYKIRCYEILSEITKLLFPDLTFHQLNIATLIQDNKLKDLLTQAEYKLTNNEYEQSIYLITEVYAAFKIRLRKRSIAAKDSFISSLDSPKIDWINIENSMIDRKTKNHDLAEFAIRSERTIMVKFEKLIEEFDIIILLRNYYEDYKYFLRLCPLFHTFIDDSIKIDKENRRHIEFNKENAEFMYNFLVQIILELEPQLKPIEQKLIGGEIYRTIK